jgi:hypothetical protein
MANAAITYVFHTLNKNIQSNTLHSHCGKDHMVEYSTLPDHWTLTLAHLFCIFPSVCGTFLYYSGEYNKCGIDGDGDRF